MPLIALLTPKGHQHPLENLKHPAHLVVQRHALPQFFLQRRLRHASSLIARRTPQLAICALRQRCTIQCECLRQGVLKLHHACHRACG